MKSIGLVPILYNAHSAHDSPPMAASLSTLTDSVYIIFSGHKNKTYKQLNRLNLSTNNINLIYVSKPLGKGEAVLKGLQTILRKEDEPFNTVQVDGDLEQSYNDIPLFLKRVSKTKGLVVGNRYKNQPSLPLHRLGAIVFGSSIVNTITNYKLIDVVCGYRAYPSSLAKIFTNHLKAPTYGLEVEQILLAKLNNYSCKNIPLSYAKKQDSSTSRQKLLDNLEVIQRYGELLSRHKELEPAISTLIKSLSKKGSFTFNLLVARGIICLSFKYRKGEDSYSIKQK